MGNLTGADVGELRLLAGEFDAKAHMLRTLESQLNWRIHTAPWHGADVSRFQQDWNTRYRKRIVVAATAIADAARELRANADQQERASAARTGASRVTLADLWRAYSSWQKKRSAEQAARQEILRDQLASMKDASPAEVQQWWASLSEADKKYLLQGKDPDSGIPLTETLLAIQDKLPPGEVDRIRKARLLQEMPEIRVYEEKTALRAEARFGWVHGGMKLESSVTQNADGSAELTITGGLSGGANTPGGNAQVTASGEISRTYHFDSLEQAIAAREQMLREMPPDELGEVRDASSDLPGYISKKLDSITEANGATGHTDKMKGTFSLEASAKTPSKDSLEGKLSMSYEQNLNDGTSTASVSLSGKAKLDLGDGLGFSGAGEASMKLQMDKNHDIDSITLKAEGTFTGSVKEKFDLGNDVSSSPAGLNGGARGSLEIQVANTAENSALVQSYIDNVATGNDVAAARDMARLYHAGQVVVQFDAVTHAEANLVDIDARAAAVKVGVETDISANLGTYYKAPNDLVYQHVEPRADRSGAGVSGGW